jgi:hypothetical protein
MRSIVRVVMAGGLRLRALRLLRIDLEVGKRSAGRDHVAVAAVHFFQRSGKRRGHFDDRFRGLHRDHRFVELHGAAFLDQPFDDRRVWKAFAEVGEVERLDVGHAEDS